MIGGWLHIYELLLQAKANTVKRWSETLDQLKQAHALSVVGKASSTTSEGWKDLTQRAAVHVQSRRKWYCCIEQALGSCLGMQVASSNDAKE